MSISWHIAEQDRQGTSDDAAFKLIDHYRSDVNERFRVEPLDAEFPRLAGSLDQANLYLARVGDNDAGTFKWRGALVGAAALQREGSEALMVPSAGNHARGSVLAAKILDMDIHVVVPETAPHLKKEGLRELWDSPKFHLHTAGTAFDDALQWALQHKDLGALLHAYDNENVVAGQGTVVDDLFEQMNGTDVDHIVLPVGGGGLVSGILQRLRETGRTHVAVHAVESTGSNSLSESLRHDRITSVESPNTLYGGSAVKTVGRHAFAICRDNAMLNVLQVTDREVDTVIESYQQDRRDSLRENTPHYEPTTLVAMAGLAHVAKQYPDSNIVVVGTGHNDALRPVASLA